MPIADRLARQGLSLPCSVGLSESEQDKVIAIIAKIASDHRCEKALLH
jgi:dTDP-4-amino-4,6-dideoxygalactose transaminase